MDIRKLQRAIVDGLEQVKGHNIVVFNTEHLSPLFERVIIASGTSNRQTRALAASVRDAVKSKGFGLSRTEGEDNGEWIIVDCGAAVVHLMQPGIRDYYHLEEIWGDKPVRLKLDGTPTRLVKAAEPDPKPGASSRKAKSGTAATGARAKPVPTPKRAPSATQRKRAASTPAQSAAATPATAKRVAPPRKTVTRSVGVKRSTPGVSASTSRAAPATKRVAPATKTVRRKA